MKTQITLSKLYTAAKYLVGVGLCLFTLDVYAEYYFVYSAPVVCVTCYPYKKVKRKHHVVHKVKKKTVQHRKVRRHYRAPCVEYGWLPGYWANGYWMPDRVIRHRSSCGCRMVYENYYYAPDRATGDDDPSIYPGMNIDN